MDKNIPPAKLQLTAEQKLRTTMRLYFSARELKYCLLETLHPEWTAEQLKQELNRVFSNARD